MRNPGFSTQFAETTRQNAITWTNVLDFVPTKRVVSVVNICYRSSGNCKIVPHWLNPNTKQKQIAEFFNLLDTPAGCL
jgi:hypothetical protein